MGRPSKFSPEFREQAVELVRATGKTIAEVARDLQINDTTLGNRVKADRAERGQPDSSGLLPLTAEERTEPWSPASTTSPGPTMPRGRTTEWWSGEDGPGYRVSMALFTIAFAYVLAREVTADDPSPVSTVIRAIGLAACSWCLAAPLIERTKAASTRLDTQGRRRRVTSQRPRDPCTGLEGRTDREWRARGW